MSKKRATRNTKAFRKYLKRRDISLEKQGIVVNKNFIPSESIVPFWSKFLKGYTLQAKSIFNKLVKVK